MIKENMLAVAQAIQDSQVHGKSVRFNMFDWIDDFNAHELNFDDPSDAEWMAKHQTCGTSACVAGFATLLANPNVNFPNANFNLDFSEAPDPEEEGQKYLGLTLSQASHLFAERLSLVNNNAKLVPDALRWMVLNDRIDWIEALEASACLHKTEVIDLHGDVIAHRQRLSTLQRMGLEKK